MASDRVQELLDMTELKKFWAVIPSARVVGGAVRDLMLGASPKDIDFASPLSPEQARRVCEAAGFTVHATGLQHGTLTVVVDGVAIELTTLRRDVDTDGRHAQVEWTESFEEDAERRDLTYNALSLDRYGVVFDYFGGLDDLRAGRTRFVGNAMKRLNEDHLRALRFCRFHARFGQGIVDGDTLLALRHSAPLMDRLSVERVRAEILALLSVAHPEFGLDVMEITGLRQAVLPEAQFDLAPYLRVGPVDSLARLAYWTGSAKHALAERFKMSTDEIRFFKSLDGIALLPECTDAQIRVALADQSAELLMLKTYTLQAQGGLTDGDFAHLRTRISAITIEPFVLSGQDLLDKGMKPGVLVGQRLRELRNRWLAGGCVDTADTQRGWL